MYRIAAVALGSLRVEIARDALAQDEKRAPLAVVIARPRGAVEKESDLLGNTKLDEVSRSARALGVRPGDTIAAARARAAELRVRVVALAAVEDALARVAEAALAFGPTTGFEIGGLAGDVVFVNVTGCAHLFGGEEPLARALEARVRKLGHACRVAVADGPRVAAAVARFGGRGPKDRVRVVETGGARAAMAELSIDALPLAEDTRAWLAPLGLRTVGDLDRLPKRALGTRLGDEASAVLALLRGEDGAPLTPYRPPEAPEERVTLEYGTDSTEALLFVTKTLAQRMGARLEGRGESAVRVELVLSLDKGMLERGAPPEDTISLPLPTPLARATDLFSVLRSRLEANLKLRAPVLGVTLRVPELAPTRARPLDLFVAEAKGERVLPRLVAELEAELGADAVGVFELVDTWVPEARQRLVRATTTPKTKTSTRLVSSADEPTRLVEPAEIDLAGATPKLLVRLESCEWWRKEACIRDFVAMWSAAANATVWVEIDRDETRVRAKVRGCFD